MLHDLRSLARALGGEVTAGQVLAPGPGHSPKDRSLCVRLSSTAPDEFICFSHCGDDWTACRDYVRDRLGLERYRRDDRSFTPREKRPPSPLTLSLSKGDDLRRAAFVRDEIRTIVRELVPVLGSPGEQYLREARGIDTDPIADLLGSTHAIGWHPAVYFNQRDPSRPHYALNGRRLGCIVARMSDPVTGAAAGAISRTYLDTGLRKICKAKTLGEGAGIFRLSPDEDVLEGLHLAEGLETALAAAAIGFRPVWSAGSDNQMASFPVLDGIECLTLFADHDPSGAGERAAREAEARWTEGGREVCILRAKTIGHDFNDAAREARSS